MGKEPAQTPPTFTPAWCLLAVAASVLLGLALIADQAVRLSATYDEVTYLRVAARWWRTGEQDSITRMGSPLTFWKVQQAPTLWTLDRLGLGAWIDDPVGHQEQLLPVVRVGGSWIWGLALFVAAGWARQLHGPRAMAMASALFVLSPNLLAHGTLTTMEMPLVACSSAMFHGFWYFLRTGSRRSFWATAALGGLAMSCKFTTILIPPILGLAWAIDLWINPSGERVAVGWSRRLFEVARTVTLGMVPFLAVMVASNLVMTGFATIPLSARGGSHPLLEGKLSPRFEEWAGRVFETSFPQDWVGFATQVVHQRNGGPSYLMGERRMTGWRHYYLVALAVKVPLAFWFLAIARAAMRGQSRPGNRQWILPVILAAFLLAAMVGSKRNYGFRYLLPMATPAIVWVSALAEGGRRSRGFAVVGLAGMAFAIGSIHPHEMSYFNEAVGGPIGGRKVLSDSNLDWGQGAKALAHLQRARPELRDLTLFYFGDTDPEYYGVEGDRIVFDANRTPTGLPARLSAKTTYLAVSASLQWGPWGPPGYFGLLDSITPVCYTDDTTIAIYRTEDLRRAETEASRVGLRTGHDPG
jgi:Dolichyl-phosphate-mannose-protein mannosyltransferase